jgi:hypothetical protein
VLCDFHIGVAGPAWGAAFEGEIGLIAVCAQVVVRSSLSIAMSGVGQRLLGLWSVNVWWLLGVIITMQAFHPSTAISIETEDTQLGKAGLMWSCLVATGALSTII